jgi:hypothetical protein
MRTLEEPREDGYHSNLEEWIFLLPTPTAVDMGRGKTVDEWDKWTDRMRAEHGNGNGHGRPLEIEATRLLPTPIANDAKEHYKTETYKGDNLSAKVKLLPTPTCQDASSNGPASQSQRVTVPLNAIVASHLHQQPDPNRRRLLPTPVAADGTKASSNPETSARRIAKGQQAFLTDIVQAQLQIDSACTPRPSQDGNR